MSTIQPPSVISERACAGPSYFTTGSMFMVVFSTTRT